VKSISLLALEFALYVLSGLILQDWVGHWPGPQRSALDALAGAMMKGAAKCDMRTE